MKTTVTIRQVSTDGNVWSATRSDLDEVSTGSDWNWAVQWALGAFTQPGDEVTLVWGSPTT